MILHKYNNIKLHTNVFCEILQNLKNDRSFDFLYEKCYNISTFLHRGPSATPYGPMQKKQNFGGLKNEED